MDIRNRYGLPEQKGEPVRVKLAQGACIGTNELGENEAYFVLNGPPATFYCIDVETGSVKFVQDFAQSDVVWAIIVGSDKNVYFSGTFDSIFYRYIPKEQRVEELGLNPSDKWVWDLRAGNDGTVYGCTYPGCKVFAYDTRTNEFRDYGNVMEGEQYARGIAVTDDFIYVGVGAHKHLVRIKRSTGEMTELRLPVTGEDGFIYSLWAINGRLFAQNGHDWLVIDEATQEIINNLPSAGTISPPSPIDPSKVYFISDEKLWNYDFITNKAFSIGNARDMAGTKRLSWVKLSKGENAGRTVLVAATSSAGIAYYDPSDGWTKAVATEVIPKPISIQSIETGPQGKLYLGGYQCGMSIYDPATETVTESVGIPFPQPEGIGFLNGKVYFGAYPGARIIYYNPEKTFKFDNSQQINPSRVFVVKSGQDRPFAMTSGDNMLFIGTTPYYGKLGGALTIYDEKMDEWKVYENVVKNQSIIGLAYREGLLCGSTTVWGGLGINPTEKEAKIFTWDVASGTKLNEFKPDFPGLNNAPEKIGGLSFGPDGLLWGSTIGDIFAIDTSSGCLVKYRMIYPGLKNYSKWRPVYLRWGKDGLLYTTIGNKLTVIDSSSLEYEVLSEDNTSLMSHGEDGSIFYSVGTKLVKLPVLY